MANRPNRSKLILAATVALAVAVAVLLWKSRSGSDEPAVVSPAASGGDSEGSASSRSRASSEGPAPSLGEPGQTSDSSSESTGRPRRPSEGLAPDEAPEPKGVANVQRGSGDVTTPFRLDKTKHMISLLEDRAERMEQHITEAEQAGDAKEAAKGRIILQRLRSRIAAVKQELSDDEAGNAPTEGDDKRAGQPPPSQQEFARPQSNP